MKDFDKIMSQMHKRLNTYSTKSDEDLISKLEGLDLDDVESLREHLNNLPSYYARASYIYNELKNKKEELERKINIMYGIITQHASKSLYKKNRDEGMTANNATPTTKSIEVYAEMLIMSKKRKFPISVKKAIVKIKSLRRRLKEVIGQIVTAKVLRDSWEKRDNTLKIVANLTIAMMNHKLIKFKDKDGFVGRG